MSNKNFISTNHPIYHAWIGLKGRCNNSNHSRYKYYGARGITYCPEWESFHRFLLDMIDGWQPGLTLDRKNNDGPYNKENCQWATQTEQIHNRRPNTPRALCKRGHELTEDNIIRWSDGRRRCKLCVMVYRKING